MSYSNYYPVGYSNYMQPHAIATSGIVWVQGIEGAKAHPVAPGQSVLLMDSDADCLYLKTADASGMPKLRVFDYTERTSTSQEKDFDDSGEFITKEDISHYVTKDELKQAILSVKKELKGKK